MPQSRGENFKLGHYPKSAQGVGCEKGTTHLARIFHKRWFEDEMESQTR